MGAWISRSRKGHCRIGELDDYATKSGYVITPFVVWIGDFTGTLRPNESEVARVHTVTMDEVDADPRFVTDPQVDSPICLLYTSDAADD